LGERDLLCRSRAIGLRQILREGGWLDPRHRPRLRVGWAHEFNTSRTATVTLSSLLPGAPFQVTGAQPAPDALVVGAGFDLELGGMVRLYGQFDGEFSSNARAFAGTGGLRLVW